MNSNTQRHKKRHTHTHTHTHAYTHPHLKMPTSQGKESNVIKTLTAKILEKF